MSVNQFKRVAAEVCTGAGLDVRWAYMTGLLVLTVQLVSWLVTRSRAVPKKITQISRMSLN
jgi:hypothetical protein